MAVQVQRLAKVPVAVVWRELAVLVSREVHRGEGLEIREDLEETELYLVAVLVGRGLTVQLAEQQYTAAAGVGVQPIHPTLAALPYLAELVVALALIQDLELETLVFSQVVAEAR
jgi:hypothetical protein